MLCEESFLVSGLFYCWAERLLSSPQPSIIRKVLIHAICTHKQHKTVLLLFFASSTCLCKHLGTVPSVAIGKIPLQKSSVPKGSFNFCIACAILPMACVIIRQNLIFLDKMGLFWNGGEIVSPPKRLYCTKSLTHSVMRANIAFIQSFSNTQENDMKRTWENGVQWG